MRAGQARAAVGQWRSPPAPTTWPGEVMPAAWRKPERLTLWQRFVRWLHAP